jgi:hypothetical protein
VKKLRYPNWWFGRYVQFMGDRWIDEKGRTFPKSQINENEMEPYIEEKHGDKASTRITLPNGAQAI